MFLPEICRPGCILDCQPGAARDHETVRYLNLLNELEQPALLFLREPLIGYPLRRVPMVQSLTRQLPDLALRREAEELVQRPVHQPDMVSVETPLLRHQKTQTVIKVYLRQGVQPGPDGCDRSLRRRRGCAGHVDVFSPLEASGGIKLDSSDVHGHSVTWRRHALSHQRMLPKCTLPQTGRDRMLVAPGLRANPATKTERSWPA